MFRRDLLKKREEHLLLHDYDYDNNSFIEKINVLADHLGDLLMLADGDKVRVYDTIVEWFKENFKPRLGTYDYKGTEPDYEENDTVIGKVVILPEELKYDYGKNNLYVSYNGTVMYKDVNYKEDSRGDRINVLFEPRIGDLFRFKTTRATEVE